MHANPGMLAERRSRWVALRVLSCSRAHVLSRLEDDPCAPNLAAQREETFFEDQAEAEEWAAQVPGRVVIAEVIPRAVVSAEYVVNTTREEITL